MNRSGHKKYIPQCPRQAAIVDQYMWKQKDTNKYRCYNGISHPIYDCKGWVNFSLPLENYPPVDEVHPQIKMVKRSHLNYRGDSLNKERFAHLRVPNSQINYGPFGESRYPTQGFHLATDRVPGYPLPDPYGSRRGCSACSGCV